MNVAPQKKTHLPSALTLRFGDIGDYVELVQSRLVELSLLQDDQISGEYDERTSGAVKHFQGLNGLTDDAVVGPKTARALKLTEETASGGNTAEEEEEIEAGTNEEELEAQRLREEQAAEAEAERLAEEEHLKEENLVALKNKEAGEAKLDAQEEAAVKVAAAPPNPFAPKEDVVAAQEKLHNKHEAMEEMLEGQSPQPTQQGAAEPVPSAQSTTQDMQDMAAQLQQQEPPQMAQAHSAEAIILDGQGFEELQARIEAKLDQPTLNDVKVTGTKLAAAGVKESAVPAEFDIGKGAAPAIARQEQQQMEIG